MGIDAKMFVRTRAKVTEEQIRESAWLLCAVFGASHFFVSKEMDRRALSIVDTYDQDGPTIKPKKGETFIRVSLFTRFWGPGYERGDLGLILGVAAWLEKRFPGGEVWYGGDSSGVCAEPLDAKRRDELIAHAASENGADYRRPDDRNFGIVAPDPEQVCEFCGPRMTPCRWGSGKTGYVCMGCSLHRLVAGGEVTEASGRWPDEQRPSD